MKGPTLILLVGLLSFPVNGFCQSQPQHEYVIISFELSRRNDQHGIRTFNWIAPLDSMLTGKVEISPLYLTDFSASHLEKCAEGLPVDLFSFSDKESFSFPDGYQAEIIKLNQLLKAERKLVQTIEKDWTSKKKEVIKVYLTLIKGIFCNCELPVQAALRIAYEGDIYLPQSNIQSNIDFWSKNESIKLFEIDFTRKSIGITPFNMP